MHIHLARTSVCVCMCVVCVHVYVCVFVCAYVCGVCTCVCVCMCACMGQEKPITPPLPLPSLLPSLPPSSSPSTPFLTFTSVRSVELTDLCPTTLLSCVAQDQVRLTLFPRPINCAVIHWLHPSLLPQAPPISSPPGSPVSGTCRTLPLHRPRPKCHPLLLLPDKTGVM